MKLEFVKNYHDSNDTYVKLRKIIQVSELQLMDVLNSICLLSQKQKSELLYEIEQLQENVDFYTKLSRSISDQLSV